MGVLKYLIFTQGVGSYLTTEPVVFIGVGGGIRTWMSTADSKREDNMADMLVALKGQEEDCGDGGVDVLCCGSLDDMLGHFLLVSLLALRGQSETQGHHDGLPQSFILKSNNTTII